MWNQTVSLVWENWLSTGSSINHYKWLFIKFQIHDSLSGIRYKLGCVGWTAFLCWGVQQYLGCLDSIWWDSLAPVTTQAEHLLTIAVHRTPQTPVHSSQHLLSFTALSLEWHGGRLITAGTASVSWGFLASLMSWDHYLYFIYTL
jgi:hypothetical protein